MFSKVTLFISTLIAVSTAAPQIWDAEYSCNTGPVQCCQNVQDADGPLASQLLALLGVNVQDVNVPVGVACNPVTVIGAGGASCEAEPVCCEDNNYQGLIALGCLPINVGL